MLAEGVHDVLAVLRRRRATCRANFIRSVGTEVVLLLNSRMITGWVALGLPSPPQLRSSA